MLDLMIHNAVIVNAGQRTEGDIGVQNGKIVQVGKSGEQSARRTIDAEGRFVLPGLIDAHVHLPWPSARFDSTDNYASGTAAAVCGGVTTTIEYVVPDDRGRLIPALHKQVAAAADISHADYAFHMIINQVNTDTPEEMATAVKEGVSSFKIYTAYTGFRLGDEDILSLLPAAARVKALLCFHAEDGLLINAATRELVEQGHTDVSYYPDAHPKEADLKSTSTVLAYARHYRSRIHIVHVNTREAAEMIGATRRAGYPVSGETCPQYLMFTEEAFRGEDPEPSYFVLAPCMRTEDDRQGLWDALANDDLQMVASDHCPYTAEQKMAAQRDFRSIPGGIPGVETMLPIVHTYGVCSQKFSLERMVALLSTNPAKIFNLYPQKGTIAVGSDADLVIFDDQVEWAIDAARLHSNTDHSVFQGTRVAGLPAYTILGGEVVAVNGDLSGAKPGGKLLRRSSA